MIDKNKKMKGKKGNSLARILVKEKDSIKEVMKKIDMSGFSMAIITDKSDRLKGVVTDGDIRRGILKGNGLDTSISEIMNKDPVVIKDISDIESINAVIKKMGMMGKIPLLDKKGIVKDVVIVQDSGPKLYIGQHSGSSGAGKRVVERVLVIGGAGYIGSLLCRKLLI
ncbi:MAG: CBS domain-containing protein [Candidatus Woesearchaeota archaeon]|nr:CBS domain-containing protein [Candidatus Woesearchaeota archaeon]